MNTRKILSIVLVSAFILISCNDSKSPIPETQINQEDNLAIAETTNPGESSSNKFLYVTASTGLSLREYANLKSKKLAVMPYGTKVKIIAAEKKTTMSIEGIQGGMNEIEYNHKKGFAFNGFLSKFFPPEKGISAKGYAEELKEDFPKVVYTETTGGTASKPSKTETIILPNSPWHTTFYIAQQLFNFPKEFTFPSSKGKEIQLIKEKKYQKPRWTSELQISRKEDALKKIEYVYKNKGFSKRVTIIKEENAMKISKTEVVE